MNGEEEGDNFIGVAFGVQPWAFQFYANDYYALTWKKSAETMEFPFWGELTAEEGFKLLRVKDSVGWSVESMRAVMWDGENYPPDRPSRVTLLDSSVGEGTGWEPNVEYAIEVGHFSDGRIEIEVRRAADGAVLWQTSVVDPNPLGAGRIGFFNQDQPNVRYTALGGTNLLTDGAYQITVHSGEPGIRGLDGTPLDGDDDNAAGGDFVATTLVDTSAPTVGDILFQPEAVIVTFLDQGGMDPVRMTDPSYYTLVAAGGDRAFGDDNDLPMEITSVTRRAGAWGSEQAVLSFSTPIVSDLYRVEIDGTEGVTDRFGHDLSRGDYQRTHSYSAGPVFVELRLLDEDDTGISSDDGITRVHAPMAELEIDRPGRIRLDLDGDGTTEIQEHLSRAGVYQYPIPTLNDGTHRLRASLESATIFYDLTIDSVPPSVREYSPTGPGQQVVDHLDLTLTEEIVPGSLAVTDFEIIGPAGPVLPLGLDDRGDQQYRLSFPEQSEPGVYQIVLQPVLEDLAGNRNESSFVASFLIGWNFPNRLQNPSFEQGGSFAGFPTDYGAWGGDRVYGTKENANWGIWPFDGSLQLQFDATGLGGAIGDTTSDAWQLVDLSAYAADLARGQLTAWASSRFNRIARDAQTDTQFHIELAALAGQPSEFEQQLAAGPIASARTVIATDSDPESWQEATVVFDVPAHADYLAVRITAHEDVFDDDRYEFDGHYADDARLILLTPLDKPSVAGHLPAGVVPQAVSSVDLTFSEPIDPASFTAEDIQLWGPHDRMISPVDPPLHLGGNVWRISFPEQSEEGPYRMAVGPFLRDLDGRLMDQNADGAVAEEPADVYEATFAIDFTPLQIEQHSPDGVWNSFVDAVEVTFSEPIDASTFGLQDVTVIGPSGAVELEPPVPVTETLWQIPLVNRLESGTYSLTVGPAITDLAGQPMPDVYRGQFEIVVPNLAGEQLEVPAAAGPGSPILLTWQVHNVGSGTAEMWRDEVYLSTDPLDGDDQLLGTFERPSPLAGGEWHEQSIEVEIPSVDEGDYWIVVRVDAGDEVSEPSEADNVLLAGPVLILHPNLTVDRIDFPAVVVPRQEIPIRWSVTNAASVPAVGRWNDQVAISFDDQPGNDWNLTAGTNSATIGPWEKYEDELEHIAMRDLAPGDYWIVVTTDSEQQLPEADETDNAMLIGPVTVQSLDLVVSDVQLLGEARSGEPTTVRWRTQNVGTGTIDWVFRDYVSLQKEGVVGQIDGHTLSYNPNTDGALGPGEWLERESTFTLPAGHDGAGEFSIYRHHRSRMERRCVRVQRRGHRRTEQCVATLVHVGAVDLSRSGANGPARCSRGPRFRR